ncbi:MAG: ABC transporter permease [Pseudomonadales bacterium]|nr:ABC transporter permease [Pseudomonadales bacterium]
MKLFGLMWSNLFRKRTRTVLTMLSVAIAFLLFMLLRTVAGAFETGGNLIGVDRLIASPKYSIVDSLPMSQKQQILAVDGVAAVTQQQWFGGVYQDPKNFFPKYPVEPREFFAMYNELQIDPAQLDAFAAKRTAAVAEQELADEYGWKIGDVIPIEADIWPKEGGDRSWEFELVGTYVSTEGRNPVLLFQYQYFTEAVASFGKDQVGWWTVRLSDPARAEEIARVIDRLFENSPNPTRTATEDEFARQFASQLGDIGFLTTVIMAAVFFTIVLLTGNTMSQALRERIPELAVLKTLGFTDTSVSMLVLGEAVLLCVVGALAGIGLAYGLISAIGPSLEGMLGTFELSFDLAGYALILAVLVGLVIGGLPALSARRLTITDALRVR